MQAKQVSPEPKQFQPVTVELIFETPMEIVVLKAAVKQWLGDRGSNYSVTVRTQMVNLGVFLDGLEKG